MRLSRLTSSLPVRIVDSGCPFERRAIAWMRAISSRCSNGLVRKSSAPKPSPLILWSSSPRPERIRIGVRTRAARNRRKHFVPVHVGQQQIEYDDVVIVELADLQPVFAEI